MSANTQQQLEYAIDVGPNRNLVVQLRITQGAAGASIQLEHAAVNDESAYTSLGNAVSATSAGNVVVVHQDALRFVRWTITGLTGGTLHFLIDVIART